MQANDRTHLVEFVTLLGYDTDMNNNHTKHQVFASLNAVQIFGHATKFDTPFPNLFICKSWNIWGTKPNRNWQDVVKLATLAQKRFRATVHYFFYQLHSNFNITCIAQVITYLLVTC